MVCRRGGSYLATPTATYNLGQLTVKVDASGENPHDGIVLSPIRPSTSLYLDGNVLCLNLDFKERRGAVDHHWTKNETFARSADYIVLLHGGQVLTARSVDKVQRKASLATTSQKIASRRRRAR